MASKFLTKLSKLDSIHIGSQTGRGTKNYLRLGLHKTHYITTMVRIEFSLWHNRVSVKDTIDQRRLLTNIDQLKLMTRPGIFSKPFL